MSETHESCQSALALLVSRLYRNKNYPFKFSVPRTVCLDCRDTLRDDLASIGLYVDEINLNISISISKESALLNPISLIQWEIDLI